MLIYLLRHLPTEHNRIGLYMGRSQDSPIIEDTVSAYRQKLLRMRLNENLGYAKIFSSSSLRCVQTAKVIGELAPNVEIIEDHDLDEINYGDFEGRFSEEIKKLYPGEYKQWMECPSAVKFPGGESFTDAQRRVVRLVLKSIGSSHDDRIIFLVSHVDVIKMLICWVMDIPIDKKRMFKIDNGSVSCLETTKEVYNHKKIKVRYLNST